MTTPLVSGRLFSPTSFWNVELADNAPLDAKSGALVTALTNEIQKEVTGRYGPWINTDAWSIAAYTVGPDVPNLRVHLDTPNTALQHDLSAVPIPLDAHASAGSDGSLVIYQPSSDTMWEFWQAVRRSDGWHASWGGKISSESTNPGYLPAPYGGTGTSLAALGGLVTVNELRAGEIDHAISMGLPNTADHFVWPAQRGDGHTVGAAGIPEGTHFRIDPRLDLASLDLPASTLTLARAAQKYGLVVRDTSGSVVLYCEDPTPTGNNPYSALFGGLNESQVLSGFPWSSLQAVQPAH